MIFIMQLVYIKEGQESVFQQFENTAIPAILKYKGRLLLRVRPTDNTLSNTILTSLMKFT